MLQMFYLLYDQVWQFRRLVLETLNTNLEEELEYLDGVAEGNPKNYQIWYVYRAIISFTKL